ncbi:Glycoside hydrolase family 105 protein [Mycena chlorophos]|uniref:Glycoside hydrolase family 105 protein n=1 Tax=Mycena chlorophos TaxID=658473 RepID=A0A8H6TBH0_MYCCL|nr:Glycoside hydrolase family 105 protein [Mycena chlorophos]
MSSRESTLKHIRSLIYCLVNIEDTTGEFLQTLDDGRIIDTKSWNNPRYCSWEWTHGVGLYGLFKFHQVTDDAEAINLSLDWFRAQVLTRGTTKNINTISPFLAAAYLHELKHANYFVHLDSWGEWAMHHLPRTDEGGFQHITYSHINHQQLWDDTLMMTVLPLTKIGLVLGRPHYVEEAKRQFMLHIKYLQDLKTGLWFHGWTFDGHHHFAAALWGRGNCWVTIAIPDFIELLDLPATDGLRSFLVSSLVRQIDALVGCQDPASGLWHTILDDPSTYLEASASAGFAYGILKALRMRLIPHEEKYVNAAKNAILGVVDNITPEGELLQTSFGTPVFDNIEDYNKVKLTSMPYGQSLALLALTEHLRTFI